mgnify:CR=1 FL=1
MKAIRFAETGGPEVLRLEDVDLPPPGAGEIRIRHTAIGINYIDTYHRSGLYPLKVPSGIGLEAAGVVEALGAGVTDLKPGDRVAYGNGPMGAYAQYANAPAARVSKVPDGVSDDIAASIMLKGLTAEYLARRTYPVKPGDTILFHAAAGGVGLIACQWLKSIGATVIGTAGSDDKCKLAKEAGATHVINYKTENFVERVFAYQRLRRLFDANGGKWSVGDLVKFHTAHKLTLMAHSPSAYRDLGRLVAGARAASRKAVQAEYEAGFMGALAAIATPRRQANVLQHMLGYFKDVLAPAEKQELVLLVADYRTGLVPLIVPVTLLQHHVRRHHVEYLARQHYLAPHPKELLIRNHV